MAIGQLVRMCHVDEVLNNFLPTLIFLLYICIEALDWQSNSGAYPEGCYRCSTSSTAIKSFSASYAVPITSQANNNPDLQV